MLDSDKSSYMEVSLNKCRINGSVYFIAVGKQLFKPEFAWKMNLVMMMKIINK